MNLEERKLIAEEQKILDELIDRMDNEMLKLDADLTRFILEAKKAKEKCLPDTYGALVVAENGKITVKEKKNELQIAKDELYQHRIVVETIESKGFKDEQEEIELKIGYKTYQRGSSIFVCSWLMPICRHYVFNNGGEIFEGKVRGAHGEEYYTKYKLKLRRKVDLKFTRVSDVTHYFPLTAEESERILYDEFLKELLERRSSEEFKSIVFSIQKKQAEIVQTPFQQDLIVQGCAGSGKSMIMMHRLPILLFDNEGYLDRNNLYIITPSKTYIEMADNMRRQLEIEDLKMGTLEQYYEYVLKKYGIDKKAYGGRVTSKNDPAEIERYAYSDTCINDIQEEMNKLIINGIKDQNTGKDLVSLVKGNTVYETITGLILQCTDRLNNNISVLRQYYNVIRDALVCMTDIQSKLESKKTVIINSINRSITELNREIEAAEKDLLSLDEEKNEIAYNRRKQIIKTCKERIQICQDDKTDVLTDDYYFNLLNSEADKIGELIKLFKGFNMRYDESAWKKTYEFIEIRELISKCFMDILLSIQVYSEKYLQYTESIVEYMNGMTMVIDKMRMFDETLLSKDYCEDIEKVNKYLINLQEKMPELIFDTMNSFYFGVKDKKTLACAPYIMLQIMYQYRGIPKAGSETLISIDEAQNLSPNELLLIKRVNNDKVKLNLYGDIKQHIEGTKGIDSWKELNHIAKFKKSDMIENYRNTRQITKYCNKKFTMNMRPINLDGNGVHEIPDNDLMDGFDTIFSNVPKKGLRAIIVKNRKEALFIKQKFAAHSDKFKDLTNVLEYIHKDRWNILTIDQVKGLEFSTVITLTGRMSKNEKYIAFTRALDELYVYEQEVDTSRIEELSSITSNVKIEEKKAPEKGKKHKKKEVEFIDYSKSKVREFFVSRGIQVNDMRPKGYLWVIGERGTITPVIMEACEKFNITGTFSSGKAINFKSGWYTKTKK